MESFLGPGCDANARNPLNQMFDQMVNDPSQIMGPPKGPILDPLLGPQGQMLDPATGMGPAQGMEAAWGHASMPQMRPEMPQQLRQHMQQGMPPAMDPAFFEMQARGPDWAQQFHPSQPSQPMQQMQQPMGPIQRMDVGPQKMWSEEFRKQTRASAPSNMNATFNASMGPVGPMMPPPILAPMMPFMNPPMGMPQQMGRAPEVRDPINQGSKQEEQPQTTAEATADLAQASQMVEMLRNSGNPKFANSTFVKFIDRVAKGDVTFQDNRVLDATGQELDWNALYDADVAVSSDAEVAELDKLWQQSAAPGTLKEEEAMNMAWDGDAAQMEREFEEIWRNQNGELDQIWEQTDFDRVWQGESDLDQMWEEDSLRQQTPKEYTFKEDNPYLQLDHPIEHAQKLIAQGKDREAILALEAEVQKNPESSEGWRQLGELWAQMDQDVEAIQCLRRGHDADPYNLDSLLALGVSCTNELDQIEALRYLRSWIENHDDFQGLLRSVPEPANDDLELLRDQVTNLFNAASDLSPETAELFVALGVIENINKNYGAAALALSRACRLRPHDFTTWNKLGATLANSGRSQDALEAYNQAIALKPNYARAWANLAIAMSNLGNYPEAARHYLSALTLNPAATHIWTFFYTAMINSGKFDSAMESKDLNLCKQLVPNSLNLDDAHLPTNQLAEPVDDILARIGI